MLTPKTKIRFHRSTYKMYRLIGKAALATNFWAANRKLANLDARYSTLTKGLGTSFSEESPDEPVNWSLTPAGEDLISRSLTDEATLFVTDGNGTTEPHTLSR